MMLVIRKEQMEIFKHQALGRFEVRMVEHIAGDHPEKYETLGEPGARELIQRGIQTGAKHGLQTEIEIETFIDLMIQFGERFELSPDQAWAREILTHPTLPGEIKINLLSERLNVRAGGRTIEPFNG